ncbi:MAG TPA: hypothetical protein PKD72_16690, partial [Gemmatales bacterium]|nr:hypothetical protein [Gemmatales bacterium]
MNSLRKIALLGTGKWNAPPREENYALQNLLDQTSTKNLEDKLLIQAGNRALYQQAGWLPRNDVVLPTPAPEEKYETCSSEMLSLLTQVFLSEHKDLKLEAFQAYQQYQRKLP